MERPLARDSAHQTHQYFPSGAEGAQRRPTLTLQNSKTGSHHFDSKEADRETEAAWTSAQEY